MKLVVVSTGLASPHKARCIESVRPQVGFIGDMVRGPKAWPTKTSSFDGDGPFLEHVYFEASQQSPLLGKTENFYNLVHALDPRDVVVALDGDDWLAHDRVLEKVKEMHEAGAWVTYGSFTVAADDPMYTGPIIYMRPGAVWTSPYSESCVRSQGYRKEPWLASHLKTFRAGLFQRIAKKDFQHDGEWLFTTDVAMMFPMLEMAGPSRSRHCSEVLYIYNWSCSNERSGSQESKNIEKHHGEICRAKPPYAELPARASDLEAP